MSEGLTITPAEIKQWEIDEARWTKVISDAQQQLAEIQKQRAAVAVLQACKAGKSGQNGEFELTPPPAKTVKATKKVPDQQADLNMTDALADLANRSNVPLTKAELKNKLADAGFDKEKLGPYFYTVIMRLKGKKRISVMQDGKIWKAQQ